ncbi:GYD domain-containing protein [Methylocaldum sp. MU1018]
MATYVLLTTLTPEGRETLHKNPDRLLEVNKEIEQFGCKVLTQYALLGAYDFLTVIEAPDNETAAHLAVDLGSRGSVIPTTLPAMHIDDFIKKLKGPKQMGHG